MLDRDNFERRLDEIMARLVDRGTWIDWFSSSRRTKLKNCLSLVTYSAAENIAIRVDVLKMADMTSREEVREYLETEYAIQTLAGTIANLGR